MPADYGTLVLCDIKYINWQTPTVIYRFFCRATDAGNAKGTSTITLTLVDEQVIFDQPSYAACVPINSPMGKTVVFGK